MDSSGSSSVSATPWMSGAEIPERPTLIASKRTFTLRPGVRRCGSPEAAEQFQEAASARIGQSVTGHDSRLR